MKEGQEVLMGYLLEEVGKDTITISLSGQPARDVVIHANGSFDYFGTLSKWHSDTVRGIASGYRVLQGLSVGDLLIGKEDDYQGKSYLFLGERKGTNSTNTVYWLVWDLDGQRDDLVYLHELPKFKVIEKGVFYE